MPYRVLLLALLACALLAVGCNNRSRGGRLPDTSSPPGDSGTDTGLPPTDSGVMDTGTPDSTRPMDSSLPMDTGTRPDSGTTDSGRPPDTSFPDSGLPGDSGLPLGDAGICVAGMIDCPVGQMCCEILPGSGIGMCGTTCP